jgi:hypothetical protein
MTGERVLAWLFERAGAYRRASKTCKRDGDLVQAAVYKEVANQLGDLIGQLELQLVPA